MPVCHFLSSTYRKSHKVLLALTQFALLLATLKHNQPGLLVSTIHRSSQKSIFHIFLFISHLYPFSVSILHSVQKALQMSVPVPITYSLASRFQDRVSFLLWLRFLFGDQTVCQRLELLNLSY